MPRKNEKPEKSRDRARLAFALWPRCPACHGIRLRAHKTRHGSRGETYRDCKCRDCGTRVLLTLE